MPGKDKGKGKVYLVGAGPGSPDLLTVKARRVLGGAGVVLYDQLAGGVRELLPAGAELIDCGKSGSKHTLEQGEIEELGAGCFTPVGVWCKGGHLVAEVLSLDGKRTEKVEEEVADVEAARACGRLLAEKAKDLLAEARALTAGKEPPAGGKDAAEG